MARILLVGTVTLDLVFALDHAPGSDEEMRAMSLRTCRGGNAGNTAVVLARLGHAPEFLGVMADAPETAVIERDFEESGVAFRNCPRLFGRPPTSSIYLAGATRSIVHYRDLPELDAKYLCSLDLGNYDWLHFEGRNVVALAEMLRFVRENNPALRVSLELEKPRPGIESLIGLADLLLCSRGFAEAAGFHEPEPFLHWLSAQTAAAISLAWGEVGAFGILPGGDVLHVPAVPVAEVVDTLGAGDTFNAGMLDAMVQDRPLLEALSAGCALAGRKCAVHGFEFCSDVAKMQQPDLNRTK